MGCFCQQTVEALAQTVAKLAPQQTAKPRSTPVATPATSTTTTADPTTDPDPGPQPDAAQQQVNALARWLQTRLPDQPWEPNPEWTDTPLPPAPLEPVAMATIAALAQAQAQIQQSLAVDLQQPAAVNALRRIVATVNARADDMPDADPAPWQQLAAQATNVAQVERAAAANLFAEDTPLEPYQAPGGKPLSEWRPFLRQVKALAPLLAAAKLLGVELSEPEAASQIADKMRTLRKVSLPPLTAPQPLARLTSLAQALAQIAQSLGADPLEQDIEELQDIVNQRQAAVLSNLGKVQVPPLPPSVANLVTPVVVQALQAVPPTQLAAMNWKVPPMTTFPLITSGLPVVAFVDQLAAIGIPAVKSAPCGQQCDAAATLRKLDQQEGQGAGSVPA